MVGLHDVKILKGLVKVYHGILDFSLFWCLNILFMNYRYQKILHCSPSKGL